MYDTKPGYIDGGAVVGARIAAHGIPQLYTLCGGHISPILVGAKRHGVHVCDVRDEASAVFAADAAARMTGLPGVAAVTAGPGVTNTLTAVKNAQMAQSPVIIFGGATPTILQGRGALQDIDQISMMRPITKWATKVRNFNSLGPTVDKAIKVATEGVPGPVFVEIPVDLLYHKDIVTDWYFAETGLDKAKGVAAKAGALFVQGWLAKSFDAPSMVVDLPDPVRPVLESDINKKAAEVAEVLRRAKKPVLVIGSQALVNYTPAQAAALARAIESMGIPTFLGGMARGLLGADSEIQFKHKRSASLKVADVVLIMGFPFDFRLGYGMKINRKATLVGANLSMRDLYKNRRPQIGVLGHPGDFLQALGAAFSAPRRGQWRDWFEEVDGREQARERDIAAQARERGELINPVEFFRKMDKKLDDDSVLVVDGGDFVGTAAYILRPRQPLSWLDPGVFGTLGVGGGFMLGAGLNRPHAETWLIYGDGSCGYSIAEFDTACRHGLAPIAVIGTDGAWAQIAREQTEMLGDDVGTVLRRNDYHTVAEGYGGVGLLLKDPKDITRTLTKAKKLSKEGKPVCINVMIDASDFRKGSISM